MNNSAIGDTVTVSKAIDSKLEGKTVKVVGGPYKVGHVSGVYKVRHEDSGHEAGGLLQQLWRR